MKYLFLALLLCCGGLQENVQDPEIARMCKTTFCPTNPNKTEYVSVDTEVYEYLGGPSEGHATFFCVCWCPSSEQANRYMEFITIFPPKEKNLEIFQKDWADFCLSK